MMIKKIKWFNVKKTDRQMELLDSELPKSEDIEILNFEERIKYNKKSKFRIKNKKKFALTCIASFIAVIFVASMVTGENLFAYGATKILNSIGIYTKDVRNVKIKSDNYDEPGSWHIDKSAKWTRSNTAQVTFDVNSIMKTYDNYKDIILVLDISGSMDGEKLDKAISDSKELVSYLLSDSHNRVAIVTFESTSSIISTFSNDKNDLLSKLGAITTTGCTNYNAALRNVDVVMDGYTKESNRDVVTLFLTDGYPNEETPNQVGTYEVLKDKYPYMAINGVQYEMGVDVIEEIKQISDSQWVADQSNLNNVLFDAAVSPVVYEDFIVTDYINNDYFKVNSLDNIKVTIGTVKLEEESGVQKIVWNLGKNSYMTGGNAKMFIDLILNEQYVNSDGFYPTNKKESVTFRLPEENESTVNSSSTPVLKNSYEVIYDTNTPDGCSLDSIKKEKYFVYQNVTKRTNKLSCDGYLFKGWEIDVNDENDITIVNDDVFIMPDHDVTIRGTWTKQSIAKTMDGTVREGATLYEVIEDEAKSGGVAKEYTGIHQDSFNGVGNKKIYHYYASNSANATTVKNKNNVIFAGQCWQMIRTTDTGGVKMIYNGEAVDNKCLDTRGRHIGYNNDNGDTTQNLNGNYYYGTDYNYDASSKTFYLAGSITQATWNIDTYPSLIGKYTCASADSAGNCSTLYYVESYYDNLSAYVLRLGTTSHYSQLGIVPFNISSRSLAYVGYMYNTVYPYKRMDNSSSGKLVILMEPYDLSNYSVKNNDATYPYTYDESTNQWSSSNHLDSSKSTFEFSPAVAGEYYLSFTIGSERSYDKASFYVDGTLKKTVSGSSTSSVELGPLTTDSVIKVEYSKNGSRSTQPDKVSFSLAKKKENTDKMWLFGNDVSYENGVYTLVNPQPLNLSKDSNKLINNHYTCNDADDKTPTATCTTVNYIFDMLNGSSFYIELNNGKKIEDAITEMLSADDVNSKNSIIKSAIDVWYEKYLKDYTKNLEDTVFCNNRSIFDLGGWNRNGVSLTNYLYFKEHNSYDLSCSNVTDRFSTLNNKAKLKYPIGLATVSELALLGNYDVRETGQDYWSSSPGFYGIGGDANGFYVYFYGLLKYGGVNNAYSMGVRPVISLAPYTFYLDGNGSMESPYIVDLES